MTSTAPATDLPDADRGVLVGLIRQLRGKGHHPGVVGVAAVPSWSGPDTIIVDDQNVRITTARSVLAIRDRLRLRADADWVIVLTDRPAADIPPGLAEHLVTTRLRNIDPFPLLRNIFAATQQEFGLLGNVNQLARAALREVGDKPAPAPGGVLTEDHLFAELARTRFGLDPVDFTPHHVACWSLDTEAANRYEDWASGANPQLVERFLSWLLRRLGDLGPVLVAVIRAKGPAAIVPFGLIAGLTTGSADTEVATRAVMRLEMAVGDITLPEAQRAACGAVATLAVESVDDPSSAVDAAESWIGELKADALVAGSDVLPSALPLRITAFAEALDDAAGCVLGGKRAGGSLGAVEDAWALVRAHHGARADSGDTPRDVRVASAALRLLRWLGTSGVVPDTLAGWLRQYRTDISWVDGAINNAYIGAGDPRLAEATHRLLAAARSRRAGLDRDFAPTLAAAGAERHTGDQATLYIEDILDTVVAPLTVRPAGPSSLGLGATAFSPVLIVVADGMDVATANDVVADATLRHRPHWQHCVPTTAAGTDALTALAVLPTITRFSRCSLLTGALAAGGQDRERAGFGDWLQHKGLRGQGDVLFHKGDMDAVSKGHALAVDVRQAVQDTERRPVIACILNDIDDALDRSDPIGTSWGVSSFKHLDALLAEAASVGRTVVLLSDHGHVAERREQPSVRRGDQISARYRGAEPAADLDEVAVSGTRVLTDDHRAVLAVDEQLRYTGLKAGYHGGGALAEVSIPIAILVSGAVPQHLELTVAPVRVPDWWNLDATAHHLSEIDQVRAAEAAARSAVPKPRRAPAKKPEHTAVPAQDSLFDVGSSATGAREDSADTPIDRVGQLLASELFAAQFSAFGRTLKRTDIGELLRAAVDGNGIVPMHKVATIFGIKPTKASGVITWVAQILNHDGVVVVAQQGDEAAIATTLLFEQFGVAQ